jgi:hypothetical protein
LVGVVIAGGLFLSHADHAAAQELIGPELSTFERDGDGVAMEGPVAVRFRPQPAYQPIGVPIGIFRLYPSIDIGPVLDSNLLATETDQEFGVGVTVEPNANLVTDWSGGEFNGYVGSRIRVFPANDTEDTSAYWTGVRTRLDIRRNAQLRLAAEVGTFSEERISNFSPEDTLEPVQFERFFASGTLDVAFGRLGLLAGVDADRVVYQDARSRTSPDVILDQTDRNRTEARAQVRLNYDLSPAASVFGGLIFNTRTYDIASVGELGTPVSRDSAGGALLAGVRLELNRLIRLRAAIGTLWQDYSPPLRDIQGLYASVDLTWFVTELTTVEGSLRRDVSESGSEVSSGTLRTAGEIRIDHELRRHIILSAEAEQEHFDFSGVDRIDRRASLIFSGRYRANRWLEMNSSLRYLSQVSTGTQATSDFDIVRLNIGATLRY